MSEPPTENILSFPHRLISATDETSRLSDDELLFQARLHATAQISAIQTGRLKPTSAIIQNIKNLNAIVQKHGESLDISFIDRITIEL